MIDKLNEGWIFHHALFRFAGIHLIELLNALIITSISNLVSLKLQVHKV